MPEGFFERMGGEFFKKDKKKVELPKRISDIAVDKEHPIETVGKRVFSYGSTNAEFGTYKGQESSGLELDTDQKTFKPGADMGPSEKYKGPDSGLELDWDKMNGKK